MSNIEEVKYIMNDLENLTFEQYQDRIVSGKDDYDYIIDLKEQKDKNWTAHLHPINDT